MSHNILALDPGTHTGFALSTGNSGVWLLAPKPAKKGRPAKKKHAMIPAQEAEPEYARVGKLYEHIATLHCAHRIDTIVIEGAAAFQRGKAAVRVGHELRGAVKAWCWGTPARYVSVEPYDLKRFATGKATADKPEMIAAARRLCAYDGDSDDEADALLLLEWAKAHLTE